MGLVVHRVHRPIAAGEGLHTIVECGLLLARGVVPYARPAVCLYGGTSGAKKSEALAEARYVEVMPHNPPGTVSIAVSNRRSD